MSGACACRVCPTPANSHDPHGEMVSAETGALMPMVVVVEDAAIRGVVVPSSIMTTTCLKFQVSVGFVCSVQLYPRVQLHCVWLDLA